MSDTDLFSQKPILTLLKERSSLKNLEEFSTSFYSRYEQVKNLNKANPSSTSKAEEDMLAQVIEWISLNSQGKQ